MASQVYFEGDFWDCILPTGPGETPATSPTKWRRVEIPRAALRFITVAAYASALPGDGQTDKAFAEERRVKTILNRSILDARRHTSSADTMQVLTR